MTKDFLTQDIQKLFTFLEQVLMDGGKRAFKIEGEISPFPQRDGLSGFEYRSSFKGLLTFGIVFGNTGYVLKRVVSDEAGHSERWDYFDLQGIHTFTAYEPALQVLFVDNEEMDIASPILNHIYNFLGMEYKHASDGKTSTKIIHSLEKFLGDIYRSSKIRIPIQSRANDPVVNATFNRILEKELDPVLTWDERQQVYSVYREKLNHVLTTKIRAHRLSKTSFKLQILRKRIGNFFDRLIARPVNNFRGLLHRYTIGKIIWFFKTVKDNLGYSIALAVYGPFTYYFITMPMNPHAMQAVGRVRSTYLEVKSDIAGFIEHKGTAVVNDLKSKEAVADTKTAPVKNTTSDTVSTKAAAPAPQVNDQALANIIYPSQVILGPVAGTKPNLKASLLNMFLSSDDSGVNNQTWFERMSNFKQMQIAYEENIEYASRMGRLEQLETQYNFPMQIETTWEELERYNNMIFKIRAENPNLSAKMKQFLFNEVDRTQQLELYLWDRMARHMLDQIYVMLDQDKEQKRNDYYVGRSFVFMQEMTNVLSWRYKNLTRPEGYDRIEKLANFYRDNRKDFGSIMKNLKANSDLFKICAERFLDFLLIKHSLL